MSAVDFWLDHHRDNAAGLPGASLPWLVRLREEAIDRFADEGWPTTRRENWRHTSLAFMEQQALAAGAVDKPETVLARLRERYRTAVRGQAGSHDVASAAGSPANAAASTPQNADHWLVFVDGRFAPALSAIGGLPGGAQIGSLADALKQTPEAVEAAVGNASDG